MKIDSYALDFSSQHSARSELQLQESLRIWVGQRPPEAGQGTRPPQELAIGTHIMGSLVQLSAAGRAAQAADNGNLDPATNRRNGTDLRQHLQELPAEAGLRRGQGLINAAANFSNSANTANTAPGLQPVDASETQAMNAALEESNNDPRLLLIRQMVKMLTGEDIRIFSSRDLSSGQPAATAASGAQASAAPQATAGFGIEYERHQIYSEEEHTRFAANGHIRTADGQEIAFQLELQMSRSYREESHVSLRAGNAQRKDPLVINFAGNAAQLTSQRFSFDLEGDGAAEQIAMLAAGSGYLALDKNGNGQIDNGHELFGVASGDGFADLAHHDDDGNGWIDENDAIYEQLRVWTPSADGSGQLHTLKEKQVGALYLGSQATPFELRDSSNQSLGAVRSSGLWLSESGQVGSLQQIDLTV